MFFNEFKCDKILRKYIDNSAVSPVFNKDEGSEMNNALSEINQVLVKNFSNLNGSKTKMFRSLNFANVEPLKIVDFYLKSVPSFKLLGVHIGCNLKWNSRTLDQVVLKLTRMYT
jgi:hypothetical protein